VAEGGDEQEDGCILINRIGLFDIRVDGFSAYIYIGICIVK
jgi:hypothetical protein